MAPAKISFSKDLTSIEREVIEFFVHFARLLAFPRSLGEIYGLLFISQAPLAIEDLVGRLKLSKGSASQGLRLLKHAGAVKSVYIAGTRRDHFAPETELRRIIAGFLKEKVHPQFEQSFESLSRIEAGLGDLPPEQRQVVSERLEKLRAWRSAAKRSLPWLLKVLGAGNH